MVHNISKRRGKGLHLPLLLFAFTGVAVLCLYFSPFLARPAHASFAAICSTVQPEKKNQVCTGADPYAGDCVLDGASGKGAKTIVSQRILHQGKVIGLAEIRYSQKCNTYWVRGKSSLPGTRVMIYLPMLEERSGASYISATNEGYSNMVFGIKPSARVAILIAQGQVAGVTIPGSD